MRTTVLLMVTAVIYGLYGLGFLIIPHTVVTLYGGDVDPVGTYITRLYASLLIGVAIVCWQIREAERDEAFKAFLLGMAVDITIATVLAAINQFTSETIRFYGWTTVIIQGMLASGFAYARFGPTPKYN